MTNAAEIAERLRACVTASGGIDCRDPNLLLEAARVIERLQEYGEQMRLTVNMQSDEILRLDPRRPHPEAAT